MKIIIAAGTGFLGKNLEKYFIEKGNQVYILTRNPKRKNEIHWDAKTLGEWKNLLEILMFLSISRENLLTADIIRKIEREFIIRESTVQMYINKLLTIVLINLKFG